MSMPRIPAHHIDGNLVWNDGSIWGVWRITARTYARLTLREKLDWHARVSAALTGLQTDAMITDVSVPIEPDAVVASMIEGVDVTRHRRWAQEALTAHTAVAKGGYFTRVQYLAVCLPAGRSAAARFASARAGVVQRFGLPAGIPPAAERKAAARTAAQIQAPLVSLLGSTRVAPATTEEIEWLYARAGSRGVRAVPLSDFTGRGHKGASTRLAAIGGGAVLFEGGSDSDADRGSNRRYLRSDTTAGESYQALGIFSHLPRQFFFPGGQGELLADLCALGEHIDWCLRITPTANAAAKAAITAQVRKLAQQFDEYEGDAAGAPGSLAEAIDTMRAEIAELDASPSIPEEQVSIIVCVSGTSATQVSERMAAVRTAVKANDYDMPQPIGHQGDLWEAMLPGSSTPAVCAHYRQFLLPRGIAGLAPLAGADLGDNRGAVLALNLDANERPVQFWAGTGPNESEPKTGSIGLFGRLGSGKSYATKAIIADTIGMGGQVVVTDTTDMGEYLRLAPILAADGHSTQVIPIGAETTPMSLDPLAVFSDIEDRVRYGTGFVTLMAGMAPTGAEAAVLTTALRRVAERNGRIGEVVDELRRSADDDLVFREAAQRVALQIAVFTRGELGRLIFDPSLPPTRLDADYVVFHAPNLDLPSKADLADRSSLLPEQVFSSALLYLVAAVARDVAFTHRDRFSLIVQDEGHGLSNPQGEKLLENILRDGRKHNAALAYGSHHPTDLRADLGLLLGSWFMFRMARASAPAALAAVGQDVTPANIDTIAEENRRAGECLYRDLQGRVGLIKILPAKTAALREAFDTSTGTLAARRPTTDRRRRRATVDVGAA